MNCTGYQGSRTSLIMSDVDKYMRTHPEVPFPETDKEKLNMAIAYRQEKKDKNNDHSKSPYKRLIESLPYCRYHEQNFWDKTILNGEEIYNSFSIGDLRDTLLDLWDRHQKLESYVSETHRVKADSERDIQAYVQGLIIQSNKETDEQMEKLRCYTELLTTKLDTLEQGLSQISSTKESTQINIKKPIDGDILPIFDNDQLCVIFTFSKSATNDVNRICISVPQPPQWDSDQEVQKLYADRFYKQHQNRLTRFFEENKVITNTTDEEFLETLIATGHKLIMEYDSERKYVNITIKNKK
jgi:hypothetical protein